MIKFVCNIERFVLHLSSKTNEWSGIYFYKDIKMISTFVLTIYMGINTLQQDYFNGKKIKQCNEFDFMSYHCWFVFNFVMNTIYRYLFAWMVLLRVAPLIHVHVHKVRYEVSLSLIVLFNFAHEL